MKKLIVLLLLVCLLTGFASPTFATNNISVYVDNQLLQLEDQPIIQDGRTLTPMRAFFEALGATVNWETETQTAVGTRGDVTVRIPIGSTSPTINGRVEAIQVAAQIINGRTYIPLRFVGEALGDDVQWEGTTRTISITKKDPTQTHPVVPPAPTQELTAHFIDVGQGDCILIEGPSGKVMLIDAGIRSAGEKIVAYLKKAGISSIDKFIATHPHEDHIGGFIEVADHFPVKAVYDPGFAHTTLTYERFLTYIDANDIEYNTPRAGQRIFFDPAMEVYVLHPAELMGDANNSSIVLRMDHGQLSFLFTGDAEKEAEAQMLARDRMQLASDIIKIGHHGSRTSTTQAFLDAVNPEVAIIQVGADNRYGHPTQEVLDRLTAAGVTIYRNDLSGTIVVKSDGINYTVDAVPFDHTPVPTTPAPAPQPGRVNINTATLEELQEIVHIGPARAEEIIRLRPFSSVDGLSRVTGIGPARLQDIKDEGKAYVE